MIKTIVNDNNNNNNNNIYSQQLMQKFLQLWEQKENESNSNMLKLIEEQYNGYSQTLIGGIELIWQTKFQEFYALCPVEKRCTAVNIFLSYAVLASNRIFCLSLSKQ